MTESKIGERPAKALPQRRVLCVADTCRDTSDALRGNRLTDILLVLLLFFCFKRHLAKNELATPIILFIQSQNRVRRCSAARKRVEK
jgi:hypothetical protein